MTEATPQELEWARVIREAANKDPEINTARFVDLEYLQHAIVAKDNVGKALKRIKRVQAFKETYGIKMDGSHEEGMRSLKTYLDMFPGFFLCVAPLNEAGTHMLCAQWRYFFAKKVSFQDESINVLIRGFFYLLQACQPNIDAMRGGMVYISDTQGAGLKNYSLKVEERVASVYSNAYPIRIKRSIFMHVPFIFRLFFKAWRLFVSKKVYETHTYAADRDSVLQEFPAEALPVEWGGKVDREAFLQQLDQNLQERYELAAKFSLGDGDVGDDHTSEADSDRSSLKSGLGKSARPSAGPLFLLTLLLTITGLVRSQVVPSFKPVVRHESEADLFAPPPALKVWAPTHFPPPTLKIGPDVQILLEPSFGQHRPDQNAVFAYAEGYKLSYYMHFLETLTKTGFRGDVVLAIAEDAILRDDVKEYLQTYAEGDPSKPSAVVYQIPLYCDGTEDHKRLVKGRSQDLDIFQFCQFGEGVYGWKDDQGGNRSANDPRKGRTVATIRYEWYWIASLRYNKHSWIMLLDARDAYFQTNPFVGLPREAEPDREDGLLYLFGENANATRLGISRKNRNWLTRGYGDEVIEILKDYPTICSGSTMGEQVAIETYLRAMVNEHDECEVRMTGSDQGFHNVSRELVRCL